MKEIITRPSIKKIWLRIEKFSVPKFKSGYTVSYSIAQEFNKRYNVLYEVIRNMPMEMEIKTTAASMPGPETSQGNKIILYQGAVNEARGLENLVNAMQHVNAILHIYGDGNIYEKIKKLIFEKKLQYKILLKGKVIPATLQTITQQAYAGINLVEPTGLNQIYSLANKFFDYIQAGIPQLTMNLPEYKKINDEFEVAVLVNTVEPTEVADSLNLLLNDTVLYDKLRHNCIAAKGAFNWQQEEKRLVSFYDKIFAD